MNNVLSLLLISFSFIVLCFISTSIIYNNIYAQIFEFNEEDYYSSQNDDQTNSQDQSANDQTNSQDQSANFDDTSNQDSFTSQDDQSNSQRSIANF